MPTAFFAYRMFCGSRAASSDDHKQLIPWIEDSGSAIAAQLISSIFGKNLSPASTTVRDDEKAAAGAGGGAPPVKQSLNKKLHMHSLPVEPSRDKGSSSQTPIYLLLDLPPLL